MLPGLRLTSSVLLSLALSASAGLISHNASPVTLSLTKQFNLTGASKILEIDQARARALKAHATAKASQAQEGQPFSVPAFNQAVYHSTTVGIGNPPKNYKLLIDTGSSNTWIGVQPENSVVPPTSTPTGDTVHVIYGSGAFAGLEYTGTVHLGNVSIANQGFGKAIVSHGFDQTDLDGILGIGPVGLTCGTLTPHTSTCVPTVTDNAFAQGLIGAHEVGISFVPATSSDSQAASGELTFGGIDIRKFSGTLSYVPITSTSPASNFVGIDQSISYGDADRVVLASTAGITDTGTTLLLIASDAFKTYQNLTGAELDDDTGLLRLTPAQFGSLRSLLFFIGGEPFEFTPNAQAWPRSLNTALGGSPDYVYLIVADLGSDSGEGLDFINGMSFLERFYQVYDIANNRVGFATTYNTYATTN